MTLSRATLAMIDAQAIEKEDASPPMIGVCGIEQAGSRKASITK